MLGAPTVIDQPLPACFLRLHIIGLRRSGRRALAGPPNQELRANAATAQYTPEGVYINTTIDNQNHHLCSSYCKALHKNYR